jgi:L-ascorbate metabolism protein UlaG (beta-lactamase superfamily)
MISLTHFGHACVLLDIDRGESRTRILVDPGTYSVGFEGARDLDAVMVTHAHPDHVDLQRLPGLMAVNPKARLVVDAETAQQDSLTRLEHEVPGDGDTIALDGITVSVLAGEHAALHPLLPKTTNNCYRFDNLVFHPGDSLNPPLEPVQILLLPAGGPWMKLAEGIDYMRQVAPKVVVPIHQAGLTAAHQQLHHQVLRALAPIGTQVEVLEPGVARTF